MQTRLTKIKIQKVLKYINDLIYIYIYIYNITAHIKRKGKKVAKI